MIRHCGDNHEPKAGFNDPNTIVYAYKVPVLCPQRATLST